MKLGYKITLGFFYSIIGIVGVIGNTALLYVILKKRSRGKRLSNIYLVTLGITDLLGSVLIVPYFMISLNLPEYMEILRERYKIPCQFGAFFVYAIGINRILALTLMSGDRYLAIMHPFFYQRNVSSRKVIFANIYISVQSFATNLPLLIVPGWVNYDGMPGAPCGFMWKKKLEFLLPYVILDFVIPVFILIVSNLTVFRVARIQRRKILSDMNYASHRQQTLVFGMLESQEISTLKIEDINDAKAKDLCTFSEKNNGPIRTNKGSVDSTKQETRPSSEKILTNKTENTFEDEKSPQLIFTEGKSPEKGDCNTASKLKRHQINGRISAHDIVIAFSTIVLVIVFLISWLPFAIARVAFVLNRSLFSWDTVVWTSSLTIISSALNPLIVIGTRKQFGNALKDMKKGLCKN